MGLVILEAMAAKTPVIASRSGGITSLVKDGYNGYLVRARNAQEIAEKVNTLLANDELRRKMGERSYQVVSQKYTWEKLAERFERIYDKYAYTSKEYLRLVKTAPNHNHKKYFLTSLFQCKKPAVFPVNNLLH